jgi:hypothetical protein
VALKAVIIGGVLKHDGSGRVGLEGKGGCGMYGIGSGLLGMIETMFILQEEVDCHPWALTVTDGE